MTKQEFLLTGNEAVLVTLAREGKISNALIGIIETNYESAGMGRSKFIDDLLSARIQFLDGDIEQSQTTIKVLSKELDMIKLANNVCGFGKQDQKVHS